MPALDYGVATPTPESVHGVGKAVHANNNNQSDKVAGTQSAEETEPKAWPFFAAYYGLATIIFIANLPGIDYQLSEILLLAAFVYGWATLMLPVLALVMHEFLFGLVTIVVAVALVIMYILG